MTRRKLNGLLASAAGGALCAGARDAAAILVRPAEVYPPLTGSLSEGKPLTTHPAAGPPSQRSKMSLRTRTRLPRPILPPVSLSAP